MFIAYPDKGPEISGTQAHYLPGDYITANCTSGKSNPAAELEWLINGAKVTLCLSATTWDQLGVVSNVLVTLLKRPSVWRSIGHLDVDLNSH